MLLRLGKEGTVIRIYKTRAIYFDTITMSNGRSRKLFQTEMRKVVEFPIYESADAHMSDLPNEDGEAIFSLQDIQNAEKWIERQMQAIDAAFRKNQVMGLMGGTAVIKRSRKDDDTYRSYPDFMPDAKIGEFIGAIRGSHKYEPKMRIKVRLPKVEVVEDKSLAKAWREGRLEDLNDEVVELLVRTADERGKPLDQAFSDEEARAVYITERKLFYLITQQLGYSQSFLEQPIKDELSKIKEELGKYKKKQPRKRKGKELLP